MKNPERVSLFAALSLLAAFALPGPRADAIVVTQAMTATTIAEVSIESDAVAVELEIGVDNIPGFRNLMPDSILESLNLEAEPLASRLQRFWQEDFVIRVDGGPPIRPRIDGLEARRRIPRDEITGEPLAAEESQGETVLSAKLTYPLAGRPATLSISPPSYQRTGPVNIGFIAYHRGIPINDFRYLAGEERVALDWDDPWYSRFDNRNLWRKFDSPVSAFLYVEPYEVRKEIVLRPRDLQPWVDLGLAAGGLIPIEDQPRIKQEVEAFLADRIPVTIDGRPVEGTLDRIHFIRRSLRKTGVIDPPEVLDASSATLGLIYVYPLSGLPGEATLEWELFNEKITRVPCSATDEAGGLPSVLSADDPVLRWQNFLKNPTVPGLVEVRTPPARRNLWLALLGAAAVVGLLALVIRVRSYSAVAVVTALLLAALAAVGLPQWFRSSSVPEEVAAETVTDLLNNVYRAFDYREESAIYDILERSAAGELLTEIYLETRRSLELENQGGARVKVQQVEMIESRTEPLGDGPGFRSHCTWDVSGSVGHWGHLHQRTNRYEAQVTVRPTDGVWKITELDLLQEERL